jgi:hypothetical protein
MLDEATFLSQVRHPNPEPTTGGTDSSLEALMCQAQSLEFSALAFSDNSLWYAFQPGHHPVCHFQIRAIIEAGFFSA